MKIKPLLPAALALLAASTALTSAHAGYLDYSSIESFDYATLSSAWTLGGGTRVLPSPAAPGSASFSIMAAGLGDGTGFDSHAGALTSVFTSLYAGGVDEITSINLALNSWAAVSGFINLGQVADGGGAFGAAGAAGGAGHIRVGAIFIDGNSGANVLAHAYQPGNAAYFGTGGNLAGDVHFDNSNVWSDGGAFGSIDFYTVALHELGHALGLNHSGVAGSVMEATYTGPRRTLTADDIAGIQAIYGMAVAVPEPATTAMMMVGVLGLFGVSRWRAAGRAPA